MDQWQGNQSQAIAPFAIVRFLPPSVNHAYVTNKRTGARFLSKEGASFKKRFITQVNSECLAKIGNLDREALYCSWYCFYFSREDLLNMTYGQKGGAATRYKKMDVENRIKLVTDSFATAIGIDDCQHFEAGHTKLCADLVGGEPQIHIFFQKAEPARFGL